MKRAFLLLIIGLNILLFLNNFIEILFWSINLINSKSNISSINIDTIFYFIFSILNLIFLSEIHEKHIKNDKLINSLKEIIKNIEMLEFQLKEKEFLEKMGQKIDEHYIKSILVLHDVEVYKSWIKELEKEI